MKPSSPLAVVPSLRANLVVGYGSTGVGAEAIHVTPIGDRHGTELFGFELSLARMLDGQRTEQDLVFQARKLGIPIDVPGLEAFIGKLSVNSLLVNGRDDASRSMSAWPERSAWDPLMRLQYQSVLKAIRSGMLIEARQRLARLLTSAPAMREPLALQEWMDLHPTGASGGESFWETFQRAERDWFSWSEKVDRDERRAWRMSWAPTAVLFALFSAALIALFMPIPSVVSTPARLTPARVSKVEAPHDGVIDQVMVIEGQWVKAGALLFTYGPPEGEGVTAPSEGVVRDLVARSSSPTASGQQVMTLQDARRLHMTAQLDDEQALRVSPGQRLTLSLEGRRAEGVIVTLDHGQVVADIDNSSAAMEPGAAVVDIEVEPQSLIQRLKSHAARPGGHHD